MYKAYKYRIYPNKEQKEMMAKHFGCVRWIYNWALERSESYYQETGKRLSAFTLGKELTLLKKNPDKSWLNEVPRDSLNEANFNLERAYKNYFKKRSNKPVFKKKNDNYQTCHYPKDVRVSFELGSINLPKIKEVKVKLHRTFEGKVKTCTIIKTPTDKYYISVLVETNHDIPKLVEVKPSKTIGIKFGISNLLTTSNGDKVQGTRLIKQNLARIKKLQRSLTRKQKLSANRNKARKRLAILHERIANQRRDIAHQITSKLVYKSQDTSFAVQNMCIEKKIKR
jgi:putative transposase